MQLWLGGKSCFSHTNVSNFRRPLQSLLFRYTPENSQVSNFNMLFQLVLVAKYFQSELFSYLPKVDLVIKSCKEPKGGETWSTNRLNVLNKSRRISAMFSAFIQKGTSKSILPDVELLWAVLNPTVAKSSQNCGQKQTSSENKITISLGPRHQIHEQSRRRLGWSRHMI